MTTMRTPFIRAALAACLLAAPFALRAADNAGAPLSEGRRFDAQDGEALYRSVCQSCHMAEGEGAQGAGTYPALAANPRLAAATYPVINILHGRKGMPAFKRMLSDAQVAAVTNYLRSHLGNRYDDAVSAADVAALR